MLIIIWAWGVVSKGWLSNALEIEPDRVLA